MSEALERWFNQHARPLPWRAEHPRDPYRTLVMEFMAQQTRIDTVVERLPAFLKRFPNVSTLANAAPELVMASWAGLGYYRRARLLHAAARAIVAAGGSFPNSPAGWQLLPGVGDYTAHAIAAQVNGFAAPAIDGNVRRVTARLLNEPAPSDRAIRAELAQTFGLDGTHQPSVAGRVEALIELGATVCTPSNPACPQCPLREHCRSHAAGTTHAIPAPKLRPSIQNLTMHAHIARDKQARVLLERRPEHGLWAATWGLPWRPHPPQEGVKVGTFTHALTHRRIHAHVWLTVAPADAEALSWADATQLRELPRIDTRALALAASTATHESVPQTAGAG